MGDFTMLPPEARSFAKAGARLRSFRTRVPQEVVKTFSVLPDRLTQVVSERRHVGISFDQATEGLDLTSGRDRSVNPHKVVDECPPNESAADHLVDRRVA